MSADAFPESSALGLEAIQQGDVLRLVSSSGTSHARIALWTCMACAAMHGSWVFYSLTDAAFAVPTIWLIGLSSCLGACLISSEGIHTTFDGGRRQVTQERQWFGILRPRPPITYAEILGFCVFRVDHDDGPSSVAVGFVSHAGTQIRLNAAAFGFDLARKNGTQPDAQKAQATGIAAYLAQMTDRPLLREEQRWANIQS